VVEGSKEAPFVEVEGPWNEIKARGRVGKEWGGCGEERASIWTRH